MINHAFMPDSLINHANYYKEIVKDHPDFEDQFVMFKEVREQAVDAELNKNILLYRAIIDNILLTDINESTVKKLETAEKYFVNNFYNMPPCYGMHLLNFSNVTFRKNNVEFINSDQYVNCINKFGSVVLDILRIDIFQIILNYMTLLYDNTLSLYGAENTLKEFENINLLYLPNIKNIEYNYITTINGLPYPFIAKKALKDIKAKKIVVTLPEYSMGLRSTYTTNFLGQTISMPLGSAWISNKTQMPIIIAYPHITKNYKIKIIFEKPIFPYKEISRSNQIKQSRLLFEKIEKIIRKYPYSWYGYDIFDKILSSKAG